MLTIWIIVFVVSLFIMVKSADWLIESAERIGLAIGLSPFIVGVLIVGMGTSFPELVSSFAAVMQGATEIVAANAIGSNIANILLVVGVAAVLGKRLIVTKSLIDLDLSLLAIGSVLFLGVVWDKQITLGESILMVATYGIYLMYTLLHSDEEEEEADEWEEACVGKKPIRKKKVDCKIEKASRPKLKTKDFVILIIGMIGLMFGAKYLIESLITISTALNIATGVIAITAVAIGTSLPELLVSAKAAFKKKSEIALGNIFGSNVFNLLVVVGLPGLFSRLEVDAQTFAIGIPTMAFATLLFIISGISRRIHMWEGAFYLAIYVLFMAKLFNWF